MNKKWRRIRFSSSELLLIVGLLLLNVGCFLGKSETVDAWCRFIVHSLDVRYWTWKSDAAVLLAITFLVGWSYVKHGTFKHCRGLILACVVLGIATTFHFGLDMTWNKTGKTFIVHQYPKGDYLPLDYKVHVPPGFWGLSGRRPLIVFLHGAGNVNMDVEDLTEDLVNCLTPEMKKNFPFIVISPASWKHGWKAPQILQILDEATVRWNVDPSRIYLTGLSMGGFGTFHTACAYPEMFAAIVPVCGGGEPEQAEKLKDVPTWAFHGDADDVVPYECSEKMIDTMKELGHNDARLTNFHGAGHGIVGDVYRNPELYRWMLKHRKSQ